MASGGLRPGRWGAALAACLLASAARGQEPSETFRLAEEALAQADGRLQEARGLIEVLPSGASSPSDCAGAFSLDKLLDTTKRHGRFPPSLDSVQNLVVQYSYRYSTCLAFVEGRDASCDKLLPFADFARPRPHLECRRYYRELRFAHALMTGEGDAMPKCLESLDHPEDREFRARDAERACRLVVAGYSDPARTCAELSPYFIKRRQLRKCQAWLGGLGGDERGCQGLPENDVKERCLAYAAYRKAQRSGRASACAGSALCLAFLGTAGSPCQAYADFVGQAVCRSLAQIREKASREVPGLLARARSLLEGAGAGDRPRAEKLLAQAARLDADWRRLEGPRGLP